MGNKFLWAIAVAFGGSAAFGVASHLQTGDIDSNGIIGIAASLFAATLNLVLLIRLADTPEEQLGAFRDEKSSIILAFVIIIIYTTLNVITSFERLFWAS